MVEGFYACVFLKTRNSITEMLALTLTFMTGTSVYYILLCEKVVEVIMSILDCDIFLPSQRIHQKNTTKILEDSSIKFDRKRNLKYSRNPFQIMHHRLFLFVSRSYLNEISHRSIQTMTDGKFTLITSFSNLFLILVRKGLQTLVGAQLVFGHGNQSGSHTQLTDQIAIDSTLTPRTIAESYDEVIIPFGRKTVFSFLFLMSII
jgi:hypothetical protein